MIVIHNTTLLIALWLSVAIAIPIPNPIIGPVLDIIGNLLGTGTKLLGSILPIGSQPSERG